MSEKPPYRLVADKIREKILAWAYRDGEIPSERAPMRHHAISRAMATKTLDALVGDGLVVRRSSVWP
ncbi:MAG: GntR family transcriptional regulator [Kiritimatiellae bacterium]|nr:GntR family transcriptional regulator [Kiritimatiellia bacterium]